MDGPLASLLMERAFLACDIALGGPVRGSTGRRSRNRNAGWCATPLQGSGQVRVARFTSKVAGAGDAVFEHLRRGHPQRPETGLADPVVGPSVVDNSHPLAEQCFNSSMKKTESRPGIRRGEQIWALVTGQLQQEPSRTVRKKRSTGPLSGDSYACGLYRNTQSAAGTSCDADIDFAVVDDQRLGTTGWANTLAGSRASASTRDRSGHPMGWPHGLCWLSRPAGTGRNDW